MFHKIHCPIGPIGDQLYDVKVIFRRLWEGRSVFFECGVFFMGHSSGLYIFSIWLLTTNGKFFRSRAMSWPFDLLIACVYNFRTFQWNFGVVLSWRWSADGQGIKAGQILLQFGYWITVETEFADDILGNVGANATNTTDLTFCSFQKLVKFFWIEFQALQQSGGPGYNQQQFLYQSR